VETELLPLETGICDVGNFNELFEHLRINPVFTLGEVHRVLKPNGILLLSTPNLRSLKGLVNFLFKNKAYSCLGSIYDEYKKLEHLGHMGHVREYTTREMSEFLYRSGFRLQTIVFRGRDDQKLAQLAAGLERAKDRSALTLVWDLLHNFLIKDAVRFYNTSDLLAMLRDAGFRNVQVRREMRKLLWKRKLFTSLVLISADKA
jgi:SAM-dependent methyltransferase